MLFSLLLLAAAQPVRGAAVDTVGVPWLPCTFVCDSLPASAVLLRGATLANDSTQGRPRAITHSDAYYTRLTIHRIGSYTMLPLFAGEYLLGDKLLNGTNVGSWVKPTHSTVAGAIGVLFAVNTITGVWNLYDSRKDPAGRTRRFVHAAMLIAADAGFVATAALAGDAEESNNRARTHRNVALGSIGVSTIGTALMWFWK
jgi:hypothetical protein